jgi:hypothetical protein
VGTLKSLHQHEEENRGKNSTRAGFLAHSLEHFRFPRSDIKVNFGTCRLFYRIRMGRLLRTIDGPNGLFGILAGPVPAELFGFSATPSVLETWFAHSLVHCGARSS